MRRTRDRARGALIGLAVGDALGTTVEFRPPGSFKPVTSMTGGGPFGLEPGQFTDDTSMALCLAESLSALGRFDERDQLAHYLQWWRNGRLSSNGHCFDIGSATQTSLAHFERTGELLAVDDQAAGNGSLMRLAPAALFARGDEVLASELAARSSRTTHGARQATDACRLFAVMLTRAVAGASKGELLDPALWTLGTLHPEVEEVARGSFLRRSPPEIKGSGYVVRCLEAALWAFAQSTTFAEGCLLAVNLGDDADTTAAIYGQLAGAHYGADGIPAHWRERVHRGDEIEAIADALLELSVGFAPR
jgi:ADP-ribosyl-[dinitrogen reductase] hydrolase